MGYAFISYSSQQQHRLNQVKEYLTSNGISFWSAPDDIPIGSKYSEVIKRAIEDAACVLFLLSDRSQNSTYCKLEIALAVKLGKTVIPIQLEDVILNDDFSLYLSTSEIFPFPRKITTDKTQKLLNQLKLLCADPEQGPVEPEDPSYKIGWFRKGTWLQIFGWIWVVGGYIPFSAFGDLCFPVHPPVGGNHLEYGRFDWMLADGLLVTALMLVGLVAICYGFSLNRKKRGYPRLFFKRFSLCQLLLLISCTCWGIGAPLVGPWLEHNPSPLVDICAFIWQASLVLFLVTLLFWAVSRIIQFIRWRKKSKR